MMLFDIIINYITKINRYDCYIAVRFSAIMTETL